MLFKLKPARGHREGLAHPWVGSNHQLFVNSQMRRPVTPQRLCVISPAGWSCSYSRFILVKCFSVAWLEQKPRPHGPVWGMCDAIGIKFKCKVLIKFFYTIFKNILGPNHPRGERLLRSPNPCNWEGTVFTHRNENAEPRRRYFIVRRSCI